MNPSVELRLETMLRAMTETIIPALDPGDALAREQAALLQGHIHALLQQQGREPEIDRREIQALNELGHLLLSIVEGGKQTGIACERLSKALTGEDYSELSLSIEQLIAVGDASPAFKNAAWRPVLDYARDATTRGHQWFKPMGF